MRLYDQARRAFLRNAALLSAGGAVTLAASLSSVAASDETEVRVTPAEDLMREHGVLSRILRVYDESQRRLETGKELSPVVVVDATALLQKFIEQNHEKLEEEFVFPRLKKAGKLVQTVDILDRQHSAGRKLSGQIRQLAAQEKLSDSDRQRLAKMLREYMAMYRVHKAREDTVVFPAFIKIVTPSEYAEIGEQIEELEEKRLGENGFQNAVETVAALEKKLGIYELEQYTPKV